MITFEKDEHVLYEVRKHWLVFFTEIFILIVFALLPILVISFVDQAKVAQFFLNDHFLSFVIFSYALFLLVLWTIGFIFWTDYYLDVWLITNKKVLDVEQHGLFRREVSILHLDKIQDITFEMKGVMATLLNYGDVIIQTAGFEGAYPIKGVPNPEYIQERLNDALRSHAEAERALNFAQSNRIADDEKDAISKIIES